MKKIVLAIAAASLLASPPALAGEITGNGKFVPGGVTGVSECSYSGRNDDPEIDGLGFTQTFAAVLRLLGIHPRFFNPSDACRGNFSD